MMPDLAFRITASNQTAGFFSAIRRDLQSIRGAALTLRGALGATFGITAFAGIGSSARSAIADVAGIGEAAERAGVSAERLQVFRFGLEQIGGSAADADASLSKLNANIGQAVVTGGGTAAKAFGALGVSIRDAAGNLLDTDSVLDQVVSKLGAVQSPAQRSALAAQIFGKAAGPEMAALLASGAVGVDNIRQTLERLGLLMSNEMVNSADTLDDRFNEWARTLDSAFKKAVVGAADAVWYLVDSMKAVEQQTNLRHLSDELDSVHAQLDSIGKGPRGIPWVRSWLGMPTIEEEEATVRDELHRRESTILNRIGELNAERQHPPQRTFLQAITEEDGSGSALAKRKSDQIDRVSDSLRLQLENLGRTDREQAIYNSLAQAGVDINTVAGERIASLAGKYYDQSTALKATIAQLDDLRSTARDVFGGMIDDLRQGKTWTETLADAFGKLADHLIDLSLNSFVDSLFGAKGSAMGGSGFLGGIGSLIGGLFGFAEGGSFTVGGSGGTDSQLVAFRASPDERVSIEKPGRSGGGGAVSVNLSVEASPYFDVRVKQVSGPEAQKIAVSTVSAAQKLEQRRQVLAG
jgi:hypothetical protein